MLTALIVDDERLARVALRAVLEDRGRMKVAAEVPDVASAVRWLSDNRVDVVFLDIELAGNTGFELFERMLGLPPVVFVTAYDQFAVRAFEVEALDYLLKPVAPEDIDRVMLRLERRSVAAVRVTPNVTDRLRIGTSTEEHFCRFEDIIKITAAGDFTEVTVDKQDRTVLSSTSMGSWENLLPSQTFTRIHRSCIVNREAVVELRRRANGWQVVLVTGDILPVSRRMARVVRKQW